MAVWGTTTLRRCSVTVANRRLDIAQCVVERVAEKRRRAIFVTIRVPVGSTVADSEVDGARERWVPLFTLHVSVHSAHESSCI